MSIQHGQEEVLKLLRNTGIPKATSSYQPMGHQELITKINNLVSETCPHLELDQSRYSSARDGQQMFGVNTYRSMTDEKWNGLQPSIGFRNSYDKTMSVGIATGAQVIVCDNGMFEGDMITARKHTTNLNDMWDDVACLISDMESTMDDQLYFKSHAEEQPFSSKQGWELLGVLIGSKLIKPQTASLAYQEWNKPSWEEFEPRTAWSFYNALTFAADRTAPMWRMTSHKVAKNITHEIIMDDTYLPNYA